LRYTVFIIIIIISGIQAVRSKRKQNLVKHLQRIDTTTRTQLQTSREKKTWTPPGKDGKASMPEQVKRPNPWRKIMMMMMMMMISLSYVSPVPLHTELPADPLTLSLPNEPFNAERLIKA
jgi:hypothetical protein